MVCGSESFGPLLLLPTRINGLAMEKGTTSATTAALSQLPTICSCTTRSTCGYLQNLYQNCHSNLTSQTPTMVRWPKAKTFGEMLIGLTIGLPGSQRARRRGGRPWWGCASLAKTVGANSMVEIRLATLFQYFRTVLTFRFRIVSYRVPKEGEGLL